MAVLVGAETFDHGDSPAKVENKMQRSIYPFLIILIDFRVLSTTRSVVTSPHFVNERPVSVVVARSAIIKE